MRATPHIILLGAVLAAAPFAAGRVTGMAFFENEVRPILSAHCYQCHSEDSGKKKGGLWLDRREGWQTGGDNGPTIEPGNLDNSLLIHAIRYEEPALQMPPKSKLPAEAIAVLEKWVAMGAPDPRDAALTGAVRQGGIDFDKARNYWAFKPLEDAPLPPVKNAAWPARPLDRFILARLDAENLAPAPDANPRDLIRRLHYDLTGLPPTAEEVAKFEQNPSTEAYETAVTELLARPSFGEHWGRRWLDVARYADSNGGDRNFTYFQAWRYRNYVIKALNEDKPYYDFVREQLAGDLLPAKTDEQRHDQLVASTFLALGPKMLTERDKEKLRLDVVDEQIDTMGRAFLGLTIGCARCHDHKFDPISQVDYYALGGIFRSTQVVVGTRNGCVNVASWVEQPLPIPQPARTELASQIERLELTMRLTVERAYMGKAGGKKSLDMLPLAGVVYDESDAVLTGEWKKSTLSANRFGAEYAHDAKAGKGQNKAIFRGSLPESGEFEVRVAYNANPDRSKAVPITVEGLGKIYQVTLDQTKTPSIGGLFEPIGRFRFEKNSRANVIIHTENTDGVYVIVDAVQFINVDDLEREANAIAMMGDGDPLFRMSEGELKKELDRMIVQMRDKDLAMAPRDARDVDDCHLRVRGETGQLGPKVPRGFLTALSSGPPVIPAGESGRRQLAEWITGADNALLDRVIVNRLWGHLFGNGLVSSVDNFGRLGELPTHPELLDHLARQFRAEGGSMKNMIREMVLSRTYRQSCDGDPRLRTLDPENKLQARHSRRRLAAEEIRDSLLWVAGRLDPAQGEATATKFGEDLDDVMDASKERLRTVYLPVARNNLLADMEVFDAANPDLVTGQRVPTTVPTQALYLMNSPFYKSQSKALGEKAQAAGSDPASVTDWLYHHLLFRQPDALEARTTGDFLYDLSQGPVTAEAAGDLAHVILASTEFLFLD